MMDKAERTALIKSLSDVVREYGTKLKGEVSDWFRQETQALTDLVEERIAKIPEAKAGKDGRDGIDGRDGKDGERGLQGEVGVGERGLSGKDGLCGIDGKDGAPGINGKDGERGLQGERGDTGERGPTGIGVVGPPGERGLEGKDGRDGRDAKDGRDGMPGRDALDIEILPTIDFEKSYPRGTFAQYRGGVIRAIRNTEAGKSFGESGWVTIWEGIDTIVVDRAEDLRSITISIKQTSGRGDSYEFSFPVLIDRGVYRAGTEYAAGDTVSHQGSGWVCIADKTTASPSSLDQRDWRLQIKAGRDGKDASSITKTFDPVVRLK